MTRPTHLPRMARPDIYEPAEGSAQSAYREITGDVPSTGEKVTLQNWVCVFNHLFAAQAHYELLSDLLGQVEGDGQAIIRIADIPADWLGSMSERTDLLGDRTTIWLTSTRNSGNARGGILVALNGKAIQLLGTWPTLVIVRSMCSNESPSPWQRDNPRYGCHRQTIRCRGWHCSPMWRSR